VLTSAAASAQIPERRQESASLTLSALTAADDTSPSSGPADGRDEEFRGLQPFSALSAAVSFHPEQTRVHWHVDGATGIRYYESLHELFPTGQHLDAAFSFSFGRRTTLGLNESVLYAPSYEPSYSPTPLAAAPPDAPGMSPPALDYGLVRSSYLTTSSNVSLVHTLSRRSSVSVSYGDSRVAFTDAGNPDLNSSTAAARFTYRLSRYSSFHAGYGRRLGQYDLVDGVHETRVDDYDVGIDYSRPLSLTSTRTTLTLGTGSSAYDDRSGHHFVITGAAMLAYRFGRSDRATLGYTRGLGFVEGLVTPLFTDTVTADLGLSLSPRLRASSSFSRVFGRTVADTTGAGAAYGYDATAATGQFTFALTRRTALQTGYRYYEYSVGDSVRLLDQLPGRQRRQTLFASVVLRMPLATEQPGPRR
jgi:hypothetical protein